MTYFVKYIPVEGHFHYVGALIRSNKSGSVAKIKRLGEDLNETEWEHVKPFLCNNEVGELPFTVIGEISPAALTFVKEGDIIDEDGVQLCYWPGGSGSETWNVIPWDIMGSLGKYKGKLYTMAKIKCGRCQHFH